MKDDATHYRTEVVVDELEFHGATPTDGKPEAEDVDGPVEPADELEAAPEEEDIPY